MVALHAPAADAVQGMLPPAAQFASADTMARLREMRVRAAAAAELLAAAKASAVRRAGVVCKHASNCVRVVKGELIEISETRIGDAVGNRTMGGAGAAAGAVAPLSAGGDTTFDSNEDGSESDASQGVDSQGSLQSNVLRVAAFVGFSVLRRLGAAATASCQQRGIFRCGGF